MRSVSSASLPPVAAAAAAAWSPLAWYGTNMAATLGGVLGLPPAAPAPPGSTRSSHIQETAIARHVCWPCMLALYVVKAEPALVCCLLYDCLREQRASHTRDNKSRLRFNNIRVLLTQLTQHASSIDVSQQPPAHHGPSVILFFYRTKSCC